MISRSWLAGLIAMLWLLPAGNGFAVERWGWNLSGGFSLNLNYDDNVIHYSSDLVDEFIDGPYWAWFISEDEEPELEFGKYRLRSIDDLIVTPTMDVSAARKLLPMGDTRLSASYTYSRFLLNPIKDVKSLAVAIRQNPVSYTHLTLPTIYSV